MIPRDHLTVGVCLGRGEGHRIGIRELDAHAEQSELIRSDPVAGHGFPGDRLDCALGGVAIYRAGPAR
ncbi:Uncharacterised protein [Mycobacteroides abscessus subsp. abscessus]|nr:Uncharacterised protein [Mycobacteroides abscessus subsp. abscessus]